MIKTPMKCCLSCKFCSGGKPKISYNGGKVNIKVPKKVHCRAGRTKSNWIKVPYNQPACKQYRERPAEDV